MSIDIFIRTYNKDAVWLKYCLQSIRKNCSGIRNTIVTIPANQLSALNYSDIKDEQIYGVLGYADDYLGQQVTKLQAWKYSDADMILYMDSDCVFNGPFTPDVLFYNGKPMILYTNYAKVGDAICWQKPTTMAMNKHIENEYMRRHPNIYFRKDIEDAYYWLSERAKMDAGFYILNQRQFSEFNYLGAWMAENRNEDYAFIDTEGEIFKTITHPVKQYWSWGGITGEIQAEIESRL